MDKGRQEAGARPVVKWARLCALAIIPTYAKPGDSGFDLRPIEARRLRPHETVKLRTGLALELPEGYELQVRPRSGVTVNTPVHVMLGTVDSGYRGEIGIIVTNTGAKDYHVVAGERIAQGVIQAVQQFEFVEIRESDLSRTEAA